MAHEVVPYSAEWKQARRHHIGSSDAPILMGVGRKTPYRLWMEKLGYAQQKTNGAMRLGLQMEEKARQAYSMAKGIEVNPKVIFTDDLWFMASLDGVSQCGQHAVEIKMAGAKDHATALEGKVPEKYYPQVQHQLKGLGIESMDYFSVPHHSESCTDGVTVKVYRDDKYIKEMEPKCEEFWELLLDEQPPPMTERDLIPRFDEPFVQKAERLASLLRQLKPMEEEIKHLRKELEALAGDESCIGGGIRMARSRRKGSLDQALLAEDLSDLDKYRKPSIWVWTMSLDKGREKC